MELATAWRGKCSPATATSTCSCRQSGGYNNKSLNYLKSWLTAFEKANTFSWISLKSYVTWPELEESGTCVNDEVPNTVLMDELFDVKALLAEVLGKLEKKSVNFRKVVI